MRKISMLAAVFCLVLSGTAGAAPYIVSYQANRADAVRSSIVKAGGSIQLQYEIINAVLAEIPDKRGVSDITKLRGVIAVEEDKVINWIAGEQENLRSSLVLPSLTEILSNAKAADVQIPMAPVASPVVTNVNIADNSAEIPWGVSRVNAPGAWNFTEGAGVKVAVIDTGINYNHPDLSANYAGGYNAINPSAAPLDDQGHGTHVAGTIAAVRNGTGVAGVAPKAKLYAVKVLGSNGSGSFSAIISGIEWATKNKMNVINMSLGGGGYMTAMHNAVKAAVAANVTVVCAAGNDSGPVNYPAKYPESIAISAGDSNNQLAYFSSRGAEIEFIAPGVNIYSTSINGYYQNMSGTSMACPHVAGLAALAYSAGHRTPATVRAAFRKAASKLPVLTNEQQGAGLIDAAKLR